CARFGPWSTPTRIDVLSSQSSDWEPALHPDGSILVFSSDRVVSGTIKLYASTVTSGVYASPVELAILNDALATRDNGPCWSADGAQLYFSSNRSGSLHLYVSNYAAGSFQAPTLVPDVATTVMSDIALRTDGLEMYYNASNTSLFRAE